MIYIKTFNEFVVDKNIILFDYLTEVLPNKSKNNIKSLLIRGNVFVNNKMTTKYNYMLNIKDVITIKNNIANNDDVIDIIYEDKDIIVINKPAGLLTISTDNEKEKTAYHIVSNYVKKDNPKAYIFIVHRLDKDTSGVLLFAKNEKIKNILQDNWEKVITKRNYIGIVEGKLSNPKGKIKSWLKENKEKIVYSSKKEGDGKLAITNYEVIKENNKYSMLNINIETGRKNQIRVHMKDIGHSVIGDKKYGSDINPIKRLGLHANVLEYIDPLTNKKRCFEAKIPGEFNKLF